MSVFLWPGRLPPIGPPSNTAGTTHSARAICLPPSIALQCGMPELTRRRSAEAREECWHVYYDDAHVGSIAIRSGNPESTDPWQWHCGFYPGSRPGECTSVTAVTFGQARAAFAEHMACVSFKADRGGFPGLAQSSDLDRGESIATSIAVSACRMIGGP